MGNINIKDRWFKLNNIIRYLIIGTVNAGISYVIFAIAIFILGKQYHQLCIALQWGLSSISSYFNQKFFVFNTRGNYLKEYCKCCTTWLAGYVLNALIIELLLKYTGINIYISEAIAMVMVAVLTYIIFKLYAFKSTD